jgi:Kef-type K+ transport system membrane component KefB
MIEAQFIAFFIILLIAVFFSAFFSRLHLPWAVALIIGGILAGPNLLGWIEINETIVFMAEIGAVFLMFMAGLEAPLSSFKKTAHKVGLIAVFNGLIPLIVGFVIGLYFGFNLTIAILMGIIFVSSSIAVVVPSLDKKKLLNTPLGHVIIGSTVIQDVASLVLISVFLQVNDPITQIPLVWFYILVALLIYFVYRFIRWIRKWVITKGSFHQELQLILLILIGVVVLFSLLGLHHIIAGFFAGFVLSESLHNKKIKNSLHTVGYGIFIPVFFVLTGANTDFSVFANFSSTLYLTLVIVFGLIISKFVSGYVVARYEKFNKYDSLLIAITSIPQLATTLAVVYTAFNENIIGTEIVTAFVILSITTTLISPIFTQYILKKKREAFSSEELDAKNVI